MDKLTSIKAFTRVVQDGGFAAEARALRLSRSAVSKYVIDLERDLGVQLLVRTTRSTSPTENGQAYYERCVAILADLEEADRAVTRLQAEPRGMLRVNAPMSFGTLHLGPAIADFMKKYPALHIQLILSDQQIDPVQEGFDVTLRIAELASSSLVARKIAPARRVICAAPEHCTSAARTPSPRDDALPRFVPSDDILRKETSAPPLGQPPSTLQAQAEALGGPADPPAPPPFTTGATVEPRAEPNP